MIRINLLPVRAFKRREAIRRQVTIYILTVIILLAAMAYGYVMFDGQVKQAESDRADLAKREIDLRNKVKEFDRLTAEKTVMEERLDTILKLESQRRGPVKILDEISKRLPKGKAWLTELVLKGDILSVKGVALDNETIAAFMSALQPPRKESSALLQAAIDPDLRESRIVDEDSANIFDNVELVRSAQEIKDEIRLKSFAITCKVVLFRVQPDAAPEGVKKPGSPKK